MSNNRFTEVFLQQAQEYSIEEAQKFLKDDFISRNRGEILARYIDKKRLSADELRKLKSFVGEKNLYNWLHNKPISRKNVMKLCFALKMNIEESEHMLTDVCFDNTFHLRDYNDIIYYYFLSHIEDYGNISGIDLYDKVYALICKYDEKLKDINIVEQTNEEQSNTQFCKTKLLQISSEDDLIEWLNSKEIKSYIGSFNATAFMYFKGYINKWQELFDEVIDEDIAKADGRAFKSAEAIYAEAIKPIFGQVLESKIDKKSNELIKIIKQNIPAMGTFRHVCNQTKINDSYIEVSRPMLLTVMLMHYENMLSNEDYYFEESILQINNVLIECGMPILDPRNPFDWLIMNSINSDLNGDFTAPEYMEELIKSLFENEE